jgi:hypothetical protein
MMKYVNNPAQTPRIFRVEILKENGRENPLTILSKSSTSFNLVTSATQRSNMFCHNAGRHKQNSTVSQLTKQVVLIFSSVKTSNLLYITAVDPEISSTLRRPKGLEHL